MSLLKIFCIIYAFPRIKAGDDEFPIDSGPESFQTLVPESRVILPPLTPDPLEPRTLEDLGSFEATLDTLPGQPVEVRKKFSNANPQSLAIAKAARALEWGRMFGLKEGKVY